MNKKKWKRRAKESEAELRHSCDEHRKGIADLNHEIGRLEKENDRLQEEIAKLRGTIEVQAATIKGHETDQRLHAERLRS